MYQVAKLRLRSIGDKRGCIGVLDGFSSGGLDKVFDGHKRYTVPPYQRGYAWTVDEVEEFLDDLEYANEHNDEHFFGFMLTVSDSNDTDKTIKIIDGQQRLSTVMMFLICARNHFKHDNTPKAQEYQIMLENRIRTSEYETKPTLTLGRTNQNLFKKIFLQVPIDRQILDPLATNDSNEKLIAAYKKIRSRISGKDVELVQAYINTLFTKFVIIGYDRPDEQKAYSLFELINNRGIRLSESDHIKNYIFSELEKYHNDDVMNEYDEIWTEMRENVTSKKQANYKTLDTFLHHYLIVTNAYKTFTRPKLKDMQRAFSRLIHGDARKSPRKIIDELRYWSKILNSLRNPTSTHFDDNTTILYYLKKIKEANAVYVYPPMLIAYERYWKRNYKILFELVVMLCFKYHIRAKVIADIRTNSYEDQMYKLTQGISKASTASKLSQQIKSLMEHAAYPPTDRVFKNLETMSVTTVRIAVALLQEVEYAKTKKRRLDRAALDRIMPERPSEWEDYIFAHNQKYIDSEITRKENISIIHRKHLYYLGNQTLLSKSNKNARNSTFEEKKEYYEQRPKYKITEDLIHIPIWNVDAILARNRDFARVLCSELDLGRIANYLHNEYQNRVEPDQVL